MTISDEIRAARAEQIAAAEAEYREVILGDTLPRGSALKRFGEILTMLGKSDADLDADLRVARESRDLERQAAAADDPELAQQIEAASAAYQRFAAETARIVLERDAEGRRLFGEFAAINARKTAALTARRRLGELRQAHCRLFGGEPPEPRPEPRCIIGTLGPRETVTMPPGHDRPFPTLQPTRPNQTIVPAGWPDRAEPAAVGGDLQ